MFRTAIVLRLPSFRGRIEPVFVYTTEYVVVRYDFEICRRLKLRATKLDGQCSFATDLDTLNVSNGPVLSARARARPNLPPVGPIATIRKYREINNSNEIGDNYSVIADIIVILGTRARVELFFIYDIYRSVSHNRRPDRI